MASESVLQDGIVLQLWCSWLENCIAIWWCSGLKIVLQYRGVQWKNCIATHKCIVTRRCIAVGNKLYCSLVVQWVNCIARRLLYCDQQ